MGMSTSRKPMGIMGKLLAAGIVGITGGAMVAGLVACGNNSQQSAPEPAPGAVVNGTRTGVIQMPDGFRNVAFTCYGSDGVFVTSRGPFQVGNADAQALPSSVFVVPNDPHCVG